MADSTPETELQRLTMLARSAEPPALNALTARRMVRQAAFSATRPRDLRWVWLGAAAAAVLALSTLFLRTNHTHIAVSGSDEPLRLTLRTGDVVLAMPDSELSVRDDHAAHRRVALHGGSALFSVAKLGENSTFEVEAGTLSIRVLGTVFSVAHTARSGVVVHVYEGRVAVAHTLVRAPDTWSEFGPPEHANPPRLAQEAALLVAARAPAARVSTAGSTRDHAVVTTPTVDTTAPVAGTPTVSARPRAAAVARPHAPSADETARDDRDAARTAEALVALGRGCEAAEYYTRLAEHAYESTAPERLGSARGRAESLAFSAAQLRFDACGDAAAARAVLTRFQLYSARAVLRERATALLVDAYLREGKRDAAAAWAKAYLQREPHTATSLRMLEITRAARARGPRARP